MLLLIIDLFFKGFDSKNISVIFNIKIKILILIGSREYYSIFVKIIQFFKTI